MGNFKHNIAVDLLLYYWVSKNDVIIRVRGIDPLSVVDGVCMLLPKKIRFGRTKSEGHGQT